MSTGAGLLIRPLVIDDAILVSSSVPESEAAWSSATTYATGAQARVDHTLYESVQDSNLNHAVTDTDWWAVVSASNRWKMHDQSPQSQTTNPDGINVQYAVPGRADSVALQNVSAQTVQITVTDLVEGVVFDETYGMVSDSGITDWYAYFFEPIERVNDLTVTTLPPYANPMIQVSLTDEGEIVACGVCIVGLSYILGGTQWGATVGIQDYSRKEADDFGNYTVVERAYAKRANLSILVDAGRVDRVVAVLASYRAIPIVFVGDPDYQSSVVYGFYKDFSTVVSYPDLSILTLDLEGLA